MYKSCLTFLFQEGMKGFFMASLGKYKNSQELYDKLLELYPDLKSDDLVLRHKVATQVSSDSWFNLGMLLETESHAQ